MLSLIYIPKAIVAKCDVHVWKFSSITCYFYKTKVLLHGKVEAVYCKSPVKMNASHSNAASPGGVWYSVLGSAATLLS